MVAIYRYISKKKKETKKKRAVSLMYLNKSNLNQIKIKINLIKIKINQS